MGYYPTMAEGAVLEAVKDQFDTDIAHMKICTKCDKERSIEYFSWKNKKKGKRSSICKICQREYTKNHYKKNKEYYSKKSVKSNKRRREINRLYINDCKSGGCTKCDEKELCCMEFHHINSEEKKFRIGRGTSYKLDDLKEEIKKCIVLCANCHRKEHKL